MPGLNRFIQMIDDIAVSAKTATAVAGGTTYAGVGTWLEWIPSDIGKLASLIGIVLTVTLIYMHWTRGRVEYQKVKLETEKIQLEIAALRRTCCEEATKTAKAIEAANEDKPNQVARRNKSLSTS